MAGGNGCIVNTLPSICELLTIFYFQETNQTLCVKYAIISSLGFSRRYFQSMRGYSSYSVVQLSKNSFAPYYVITFLQDIHSYVRNAGI